MNAGRLGIVTGLPGEARAARGAAALVLCADGSPERARSHAEALTGAGVAGLVSFGVAGGLDPALPPGTVVVATGIATPAAPCSRSTGTGRTGSPPGWSRRFA